MHPRQRLRRAVARRAGASPLFAHLRRKLAALKSDASGNTVILAAIMMPVLIGGMGLGTEAGYWYWTQRKLQHAADVSSHAAGIRKRAGDDDTEIEATALNIATKAGYEGGADNIEVNSPPVTYSGDNPDDAVEVVLTETRPRLFSSILGSDEVTLSARAVVEAEGGGLACLLALAPTGVGVNLNGNPSVNLTDCNIAANSSSDDAFSIGGSATASTECVYTVGGGSVQKPSALTTDTDECSEKVKDNSPVTADPYKNVPEPTPTGACKAWSTTSVTTGSGKNKVTYQKGVPGHYCSITFKGDVRLDPGLYIVNGGTLGESGNTTVKGTDVTFFLTNGADVKINSNSAYDLRAPTEEAYESNPNLGYVQGVLFFGDRDDSSVSHKVNGGSSSRFQGAVYFPASAVEYTGGASVSGGCTQVIGYTISFKGNSGLEAQCDSAGTSDIMVDQKIVVVE